MSDTYRERVWQAIAGSLNTATGHYGDVCDTVRDAVMAVRDAELAQARTERDQARDRMLDQYNTTHRQIDRVRELEAALRERTEERDQWRLRASDYWTLILKARGERDGVSRLLRGMARRVAEYRGRIWIEHQMWHDVAGDEGSRVIAELRARLATAVVLPDDWHEQLANEVPDTWLAQVMDLVESWRETST